MIFRLNLAEKQHLVEEPGVQMPKTTKPSLLMVYLWSIAKELRLTWGTLGFNLLNCKDKKAIIADVLSVEYCEEAALNMRNPRVQMAKTKKPSLLMAFP